MFFFYKETGEEETTAAVLKQHKANTVSVCGCLMKNFVRLYDQCFADQFLTRLQLIEVQTDGLDGKVITLLGS